MLEFAARTAAECDVLPGGLGAAIIDAAARGELRPEQVPPLIVDYIAPSLDTTISAIGSLVWQLATHPDQWAALQADRRPLRGPRPVRRHRARGLRPRRRRRRHRHGDTY
jgi:cytochrome P450